MLKRASQEEDLHLFTLDDVKQRSNASITVVKDRVELAKSFAATVIDLVREKNTQDRDTVIIMPVGPTGQWELIAEMAVQQEVSLQRLHIVSMDEYLLDDGVTPVPEENPFSFAAFIKQKFLNTALAKCNFKTDHWVVPDPADIGNVARKIAEWGGVDVAFAGIGLNGHLAFNEAPGTSESWTDETFPLSTTRILRISDTTKATNSIFGTGGDLTLVPDYAITIGMREILGARQVHVFLDWAWQRNVFRRTLCGPVGMRFPASYLQEHGSVRFTITEEVATVHPLQPE